MTQPFPRKIEERLPSDNELISCRVVSVDPLAVDIRGGAVPVGVAGSYIPAIGDTVAVLRQGGTYLALGANAPGVDATNTVNGFNGIPTGDTTTSAAYTNFDTVSFMFTKRFNSTAVRIDYVVSCYTVGAVDTKPQFGIDFVDQTTLAVYRYDIFSMLINPISTHTPMSAVAKITGLPAGVYEAQAIWLRASGAGTLTVDSNDWVSLMASEVS